MGLVVARVLGCLLLLAACRSQSDGKIKAAPAAMHSAPAQKSAAPQAVPPPLPWAEALRSEQYREAERAFEALPAEARHAAEIRFAWARTRLELGRASEALPLLKGLEQSLPVLADQVQELRSRATLASGSPAEAAELLEARADAESLARAARAWFEAGDTERAFKVAARGLGRLGKGRGRQEREAMLRFARGLAAEKLGKAALWAADFRFVVVEAPLSDEAKVADEKLSALGDKSPLSPKDRLGRARALASAGRVEDLEAELRHLEGLANRVARPGVFASLRAQAIFNSRGDYEAAAKLFEKASQLGTEDVAKELYYVARSRARAQDDDGAEQGYRRVMQRFARTSWAEHAEVSIARIHLAAGAFEKAAAAYGHYLQKRGGKARYFDDASYERAVALLAARKPAEAEPLLKRLAARTKDERFEAQLRELLALSLLQRDQREQAISALTEVMQEFPLSFPALMAAARLRALGAKLPDWIEPAKAGPTPPPLQLELPAQVAALHRMGLERDASAALYEEERRLSRAHAPRSGEALCELYGQLDIAERRYAVGQSVATSLGLDHAPGPRSRWMWDCVYPRPYPELVTRAERERLLPHGLLWSLMRQESGFRPAVRSPVGAIGLMQLMPSTAKKIAAELGLDSSRLELTRAHENVRLGSAYLRKLLDTFRGNVPLALASYNAGPHAVSRWLASGEDLPLDLFVARIPYDETRGYVMRVLGNTARYAYLESGANAVPVPPLALPKGIELPENSY